MSLTRFFFPDSFMINQTCLLVLCLSGPGRSKGQQEKNEVFVEHLIGGPHLIVRQDLGSRQQIFFFNFQLLYSN